MYSFKFFLKADDIFRSTINFHKRSKAFIFDIIFTTLALLILLYSLLSKTFFTLSIFRKIVLIFSCLIFPVLQPLIFYIKSVLHANKIENIEIEMIFDDKVYVKSKVGNADKNYKNIYNVYNFKDMIVIMYDSIHGQIMSKRIFDKDNKNIKDEFYNFLCNKIDEDKKEAQN